MIPICNNYQLTFKADKRTGIGLSVAFLVTAVGVGALFAIAKQGHLSFTIAYKAMAGSASGILLIGFAIASIRKHSPRLELLEATLEEETVVTETSLPSSQKEEKKEEVQAPSETPSTGSFWRTFGFRHTEEKEEKFHGSTSWDNGRVNYDSNLSNIETHDVYVSQKNKGLKDCTIFFLPEIHDREADRVKNALFIQTEYKEGDIVLVESWNENETCWNNPQTAYVGRQILVGGWDNQKVLNEFNELKRQIFQTFKDLKVFFKEHQKDPQKALTRLNKSAAQWMLPLNKTINIDDYDQNEISQYASEYSLSEEQVKRVLIISKTFRFARKIRDAMEDKVWKLRQIEMKKQVVASLQKHKRVFIIAGRTHFAGISPYFPINGSYIEKEKDRLINEKILLPYLNQQTYAVLNPKPLKDEAYETLHRFSMSDQADSSELQELKKVTEQGQSKSSEFKRRNALDSLTFSTRTFFYKLFSTRKYSLMSLSKFMEDEVGPILSEDEKKLFSRACQ